jgi:hypothetical protein
MKTQRRASSFQLPQYAVNIARGASLAFLLVAAGCGDSSTAQPAAGNAPDSGTAPSAPVDAGAVPAAAVAPAAPATPAAPKEPARLVEAAALMNLAQVPLFAGAEKPAERTVTSLVYLAPGGTEEVFGFHRDQFTKAGWSAVPGASVTPQSASTTFTKDGFHLSLTAYPQGGGKTAVNVVNHGNVQFAQLPLPSGAKAVYTGPTTGIFTVDVAPDKAADEIAAGLKQAGWEPYGAAAPTRWFRRNAVRLSVMTGAAPAQGGKTNVSFTAEMMPMEVPVPEGAADVQLSSGLKRLIATAPLTAEQGTTFYREALANLGWECTTPTPLKIERDDVSIFRNPAGDTLRMALRASGEEKLRIQAEYLSAADLAEMKRKLDEQAEAYKKRQQEGLEKP